MKRFREQGECVSKYKGVYFDQGAQKWRVELPLYGGPDHIGYFDDEGEAAMAYNARADEMGYGNMKYSGIAMKKWT